MFRESLRFNMKRSKKLNRVSWAPGVKLCQVKLFLKEDCPLKVAMKPQDHLRGKTSWKLHSDQKESRLSSNLPPGFGDSDNMNRSKEEKIHLPRIKWQCPPNFVVSYNWHVTAGEESEETGAQKLREMRVFEAVYPRSSAIPPSPSVSLDIEQFDDRQTPLIPIVPIEDEEAADTSGLAKPMNTPLVSHPPALHQVPLASDAVNSPKFNTPARDTPTSEEPGIGADVFVAASTAMTAVLKSKEQGSLIDTDLLVQILSDPKVIEKLIDVHGSIASKPASDSKMIEDISEPSQPGNGSRPCNAAANAPMSMPKPVSNSIPLQCPKPDMVVSPMPPNRNIYHASNGVQGTVVQKPPEPSVVTPKSESNVVIASRPIDGNMYSIPQQVQPSLQAVPIQPNSAAKVQPTITCMTVRPSISSMFSFLVTKANPVKDVNYFKNLIKEHGEHRQEIPNSQTGSNYNHFQNLTQDIKGKTKIQRPCMYFKSSKGCRNGTNCLYLHDMTYEGRTGGIMEASTAKKMKLNG